MIPGPYSICHVAQSDESDGSVHREFSFGYDTAAQAFGSLPQVASDSGVSPEKCAVIRSVDKEEMEVFKE